MNDDIKKLSDKIKGLKGGEHLSSIYTNRDEGLAVAVSFLETGLMRGELCLYILDQGGMDPFFKALQYSGIDSNAYIESGQLTLVAPQDLPERGGQSGPDWMIRLVNRHEERSAKEGYSGLRVMVEMSLILEQDPSTERIFEYESKLSALVHKGLTTVVCHYDEQYFEPATLLDVIHTHSRIIINAALFQNPSYITPEDLLMKLKGKGARELYLRIKERIIEHADTEAERIRVKERLAESERRIRSIIEDQTELICRFLPDMTLTFVNSAYCRYFEKGSEDLIGHKFIPLIPEDDWEKIERHFASFSPKNPIATHEHRVVLPDGAIRWHQWTNRAFFDDQGAVIEFQAVGRDITDRKKIETALQESEKRYRGLFENMNEGIWVIDKDAHTSLVNPRMAEMLGYTVEEMKGMHLFSFMDERCTGDCKVYLERRRSGIKERHDFEFVRRDGTRLYTLLESAPLYNEKGEYSGALLAVMDISDRKIMEEALKENEARYRIIFDNVTDALFVHRATAGGVPGGFVEANEAACQMLGFNREELLRLTPMDITAPEEAHFFTIYRKSFYKERHILAETVFKTKDGGMLPVEVNSHLFFIRKRPFVLTVARDISERKKHEEAFLDAHREMEKIVESRTSELKALKKRLGEEIFIRKRIEDTLRENEERCRAQYKGLPMPTFTWEKKKDDLDFILVDYNDASLEYTHGQVMKMLGVNASSFFADQPEILKHMRECYLQKASFTREVQYTFKSDRARVVSLLVKYAFIHPNVIMAHLDDITERKKAEMELSLKDRAIASSINAFVMMDFEGMLIYVNKAFLELSGYESIKDVLGRHISFFLENPGESRLIKDKVIAEGSGKGEIVGRKSDGALRTIHYSATLIREENGAHPCIICFLEDMTEKRDADERLNEAIVRTEKSHSDMLSILNMLRIGSVMTDKEGRITFLSGTAQEITALSKEEAIGRHWGEALPIETEQKRLLTEMGNRPPEQREKLSVCFTSPVGNRYWVEIEIKDDPNDSEKKILIFYDVSNVYDLRRMLDERAQFHDLVGKTSAMRKVFQQIKDVSRVDWTVLIEGATGTGKELVARAIHFSSPRKDKPFVAVNCAGLTDSLLSSQLFGHRKGSFTGAIEDQIGLFESANGGAIFLDEIGDISVNVQTSLLRVLEQKEITRVGESLPRKIDVRVITATNRSLLNEVEQGRFRADLFYRIRIARIQLPPLKERREDIPLLVDSFLRHCRALTGKEVTEISSEAMRILMEYDWPGNVRELRSSMEFAVTHCKSSVVLPQDLPQEILEGAIKRPQFMDTDEKERTRIESALKAVRGNRTEAARILGMSRATLYRRLSLLGIDV